MPRLWRLAGTALLALGAIDITLPVLPTTIFWILAVPCFLRAGDARAAWILDHPRFGPAIRLFIERGAMTRAAKLVALGGMGIGATALVPVLAASPWAAIVGWAVLALSALFVVSRPEPSLATVGSGRR